MTVRKFKTTDKDFKYFRERCLYWRERFGLIDWRLTVIHTKDEDMPLEDARAAVVMNGADLCTAIHLNRNWEVDGPTRPFLDRCALHEILHLLTHEIVRLCGFRYGVASDDVPHEAHRIIRRIEAAIHGTEVE